jgi:hypothetical protein
MRIKILTTRNIDQMIVSEPATIPTHPKCLPHHTNKSIYALWDPSVICTIQGKMTDFVEQRGKAKTQKHGKHDNKNVKWLM